MNILITGGTGFIGSLLSESLVKKGHRLTILSRSALQSDQYRRYITSLDELSPQSDFSVIINLAGEPIANKRWSERQKDKIVDSRLSLTQRLVDMISIAEKKPKLLISASAVGVYGVDASDENISETSLGDNSFSSQLCQQWEKQALEAQHDGVRVCLLRTGLVLGNGGLLNKLLPQYKLALGGQLGDGRQWMPWIHIEDHLEIIHQCIRNTELQGAINCTAPMPVTNYHFNRLLAAAVARPAVVKLPSSFIKLVFGQMGEELLLSGKCVVPTKLQHHGFEFKYTQLQEALTTLV